MNDESIMNLRFDNIVDALAWLDSFPEELVVRIDRMDTLANPRDKYRNRIGSRMKNIYKGWRVMVFTPVNALDDGEFVGQDVLHAGDGETLLEAINVAFEVTFG